MSLKKLIHAVAISAVAAGSLAPLSSAANAGEWRKHGKFAGQNYSGNYGKRWNGGRHNGWNNAYAHRRHRDHTGRNIAIGAFATILGLALAAEASKVHRDYYDSDYDNGY